MRPNFVTFEPHGVNNRSRLPRELRFTGRSSPHCRRNARSARLSVMRWPGPSSITPRRLRSVSSSATTNIIAGSRLLETVPWLISPLRKAKYQWLERGVERSLSGLMSKRYFLVALQVQIDAQVLVHSDFKSIPEFIEKVMASFAKHADAADHLVIKHHPLDRGYHDYSALLDRLQKQYGVAGQDPVYPRPASADLLANTRGVVVINSTVGLSALHHGTPVVAMGEALYDIEGLTAQCALDDFWSAPERWYRTASCIRRFLPI